MAGLYEGKIKQLGLVLPKPPKPVGAYCSLVESGPLAFLSGQISKPADAPLITGKAGQDLNLAESQEAARVAAMNAVSVIQSELGFERFQRVLRVVGYVQCLSSFTDIHLVVNGASDLFEAIFGEQGIHARSAVGMVSLPLNAAVELEVTLQIKEK